MRRSTIVRALLFLLVLALAAPAARASDAESPCLQDASLCAAVGAPAVLSSCKSIGAFVLQGTTSPLAVADAIANASTPSDSAKQHVVQGDVPGLHVGAIEASCGATVSPSGARTACGRAGLGDFSIDLRPYGQPVVVRGYGLTADGCTASTSSGTHNIAWFEQLEVVVTPTACAPTTPATCAPKVIVYPTSAIARDARPPLFVPGVDIVMNEQFLHGTGCAQNQGSALRVSTADVTFALGWVSTAVC